jgi:voltage-dependent potassium channel beta subunit
MEMEYRRMGDSGLKLSVLSFGSWITFGGQMGLDESLQCMQNARDAGVNFFDNAEVYAGGESETLMGEALQQLDWPRWSYVVSTKFYWGIHDGPNTQRTLNRKYLMEAIDGSLERLQLDHVDLVYCHRPDPDTPLEETVHAMSEMVSSGKAHYWGTSEWSAAEIYAAYEIAERHHLHKPQVEQPQYNMFHRDRVENEYARLYEDVGIGTTTWSPLASGLLTGKYIGGQVPEGSRADQSDGMRRELTDEAKNTIVKHLATVADELDCSLAQLALAWCASNPNVTSVITGASRPSQVTENMAALEVLDRLDEEILARIDEVLQD